MSLEGLEFRTRGVTPEEKAALEVVLDAIIDEESAEERAVSGGRQSLWERSQRTMRDDIDSGIQFGVDYRN